MKLPFPLPRSFNLGKFGRNAAAPDPIVPMVKVTLGSTMAERRDMRFRKTFRIGRSEDCDVQVDDDVVSRNHAEVSFSEGQWHIRDLSSSNGVYVGDQRVAETAITETLTIRLGIVGPQVVFRVEPAVSVASPTVRHIGGNGSETMVARYVQRYFGKSTDGEPLGEHTKFVRAAFQQVQIKQKRRYGKIIGSLAALVLAVASFALYEHHQVTKQRALAEDLFYSMKALDVEIASFEQAVANSNTQAGADQIKRFHSQRQQMEGNYNRFLSNLNVYNPKMSERDKLVLRVARIFGECELDVPKDFVAEVNRYIAKWQASGRYAQALRTARDHGYVKPINDEFLSRGLPPQFFYLAMQESNFNPYAVGPITRKGYAKGMWQFIPETAQKYGLRVGPLADLSRPDPGDDRSKPELATKAAAQYIQELYATDAQASGLLVMACYNWGEGQVLPIVRAMPDNPRERNFWKLLQNHRDKIPQETYDYVFYIVSAAVIGENPRLFGFDFDGPLANGGR